MTTEKILVKLHKKFPSPPFSPSLVAMFESFLKQSLEAQEREHCNDTEYRAKMNAERIENIEKSHKQALIDVRIEEGELDRKFKNELSLLQCLLELSRIPNHKGGDVCGTNKCDKCNWDVYAKEYIALDVGRYWLKDYL